MVRSNRLDMTIAVDWDIKPLAKQEQNEKLLTKT